MYVYWKEYYCCSCDQPVQYLGHQHCSWWHHVAGVGPSRRAHGYSECEHEGQDGDHSQGQTKVLEILKLVVEVEEHADKSVPEGAWVSSDEGHGSPLEEPKQGNGEECSDKLSDGDDDGGVDTEDGWIETDCDDVAGLGHVGCDAGHGLEDGQEETDDVSPAGPVDALFKFFPWIFMDFFLLLFQDLVDVLILIEEW